MDTAVLIVAVWLACTIIILFLIAPTEHIDREVVFLCFLMGPTFLIAVTCEWAISAAPAAFRRLFRR